MRTFKGIVIGIVVAICVFIVTAFVVLDTTRVDYHLIDPYPVGEFTVTGEKLINVLKYSDSFKENICIDKIYR